MTVITPTSPWHPRRLARTAAFMLAAIGVAGGAFLAVLRFQPAVPAAEPAAPGPPSALVLGADPQLHHGMGPVERLRYQEFDGGRLVSEFAADDLSPRKDGTVDVTRPEARFYLKNGQYLKVTGDTGEIAFGNKGGDKAGFLSPGAKMPDTGKLRHVHIRLYPTVAAPEPTLTVDTDNVRFDNDALRLYTERVPATTTDPEVPADRVPVIVGGADYEMYGTGLTLRLSAGATSTDRQLHLLEISHGNRLTIRHPAAMNPTRDAAAAANGQSPAAPPRVSPPAAKEPAAEPPGSDGRPSVASAVPAAVVVAAPSTAAVAPVPQAYRAVFNDDVRIAQGDPSTAGRTIGLGDVLTLDFAQKRGADAQPAVVAPTVAPPAATPPATPAAAPPSTRPAVAATRPARPGEEPVTIYWTGKLRVTPCDVAATMVPLDPGQAAVRLAGRPATLAYDGATAEAAVATYRTVDDAVRLDPSPAWPVVRLSQPQKGMAVEARSVDYDPATAVCTIVGPATLRLAEAGHQATMTATWADRGLLHVVTDGASPTAVDRVDLAGDVRADDPRFSLSSRRLLLDLDGATTRPAGRAEAKLRRLTAVGGVICRLLRPGQPDEGIEGDRLVVAMAPGPDGAMAPRDVFADGRQVHAFDDQQALYADHLEAVLAPKPTANPSVSPPLRGGPRGTPAERGANGPNGATRPAKGEGAAPSLESLYASGHVRAALGNGSTAVADVLRETTGADGRLFVELSAAGGARVTDAKQDELVGSVLHMTVPHGSNQAVVVVDGPGTLHTVSMSTEPVGKPATRPGGGGGGGGRPIDVSWTDGLSFDDLANTADVVGHVLVRSVDPDGTVNGAVGNAAHIDFADAPRPKGVRPRGADENFGNKQLRVLTLSGQMQAKSDLTVDGFVVRHRELHGDRLVYTASDGIARVPGSGRMLVESHRQPGAAAAGGDATGGKFGTMAVGWQRGLAYDQPMGRVRITGDVRVGFLQDSARPADGGPMRMRSDELVIEMRKGAGADAGKPQVSDLVATGGVHLVTPTLDVHCHAVDLRPDADLLVATGTDAEPGRAVDMGGKGVGGAGGAFAELEFDTKQDTVRHVEGVSGTLRR